MATAPVPGAKQRGEAEKAVITITVDEHVHRLRVAELTALDVGALRQATGWRPGQLLALALTDSDLDVGAAMIWLARRQNGEPRLAYATVAAELTYQNELLIGDEDPDEAEEDEDSPEA